MCDESSTYIVHIKLCLAITNKPINQERKAGKKSMSKRLNVAWSGT